jgi:hypothetical protein
VGLLLLFVCVVLCWVLCVKSVCMRRWVGGWGGGLASPFVCWGINT